MGLQSGGDVLWTATARKAAELMVPRASQIKSEKNADSVFERGANQGGRTMNQLHGKKTQLSRRRWVAAIFVGTIVQLAVGGFAAADQAHRVTLVTGELKDPFYVTMAAGAKSEAEKRGVTLSWQGPSAWDPSLQIPVFDSVLASKPEFLIAVPDDDKALILPLKKFGDAGIPVLTADTDVADPSVRIGNITSDNTVGGTLSAKTIAKVLDEKGEVFLLCDPPGITTTDARKAGFESEIKNHPGLKYIGSELYNGTDPADAARVTDAVMKRNPNLAGMVACDGQGGLGAATAINESGKAGKVKLVSFDASPDLVGYLKRDLISALMIQQSYNMGAMAVDFAVRYLNGERDIPAQTRLEYIVGNKGNIDSPEVKKFLFVP